MVLCFGFTMRIMLITHWCSVVAEQCLHSVKDFSVSHAALPARRLGVHKKLGGDRTRTANPIWPKDYCIPYDIMLKNKKGGTWQWEKDHCSSMSGWTSVSRRWAITLCITCFVNSLLLLLYLPLLLNCLSTPEFYFFFFQFSPPSDCGGVSEWLWGA